MVISEHFYIWNGYKNTKIGKFYLYNLNVSKIKDIKLALT